MPGNRNICRGGIVALLLAGLVGCAPSPSIVRKGAGEGYRLHAVNLWIRGELAESDVRSLVPFARGAVVDTASLAAARDSLENRLHLLPGHPFARVSGWRVVPWGSRMIDLDLLVDAGPVAIVDSLVIRGVPSAYLDEVEPLLGTSPGAPFDPSLWSSDLEKVYTTLLEHGHPFARVTTSPLVMRDRGDTVGVLVGMDVTPGRRVKLDQVSVSGLVRTNHRLAARAARIPPGTTFRPERLKAARRRLLATGWFADVSEAELLRGSDGRYGVLYRVREGPAGSISGVVGLAQQGGTGLTGALDASLINMLGTGRSVEVSWRRDYAQVIAFRVAYGEPFLFGGPFSFRFQLSQEAAESSWVALDASAALGLDVGTGWRLSGEIARREVNADSLAQGPDSLTYSLLALQAAIAMDTRNRPLNPSEGGFYRAGAERGWALGDNAFSRIDRSSVDLEQSLQIRFGWVAFAGLHGVEVSSDAGILPSAEWERLGGAATVRGYAERSLIAPRAGWLNLELRRLLGGDNRVFALADVAVLDGAGDAAAWKASWGLGAQVGTGIGAVQVAVAVPTGEGFSAATVHLIARTTF